MEEIISQAKNAVLQLVDKSQSDIDLSAVEKAIGFMNNAHKGQLRVSGEPYILRNISVAKIITEQRLDNACITAALLHNVTKDANAIYDDIEKNFGTEVAKVVDRTIKLTKLGHHLFHINQAGNLRKLFLIISEDVRALVVKLTDRINTLRTLNYNPDKEKSLGIAQEAMEIYCPLAESIGLYWFKNELQDLAFAAMYPEIRTSIVNRMQLLRSRDKELMLNMEETLRSLLSDNNVVAEIYGREKTAYSIWLKMRTRNRLFEQIGDIFAFRIIVPSIAACYSALKIIHARYKNIPNSFKDYISTPKGNGYQSLHTLVVVGHIQHIEIQIRTYEMHEVATYGKAAHWAYKLTIQNATKFD